MKIKTGDTIHIKLDNNDIIEKMRNGFVKIVFPDDVEIYENIYYYLIDYVSANIKRLKDKHVTLIEKKRGFSQQIKGDLDFDKIEDVCDDFDKKMLDIKTDFDPYFDIVENTKKYAHTQYFLLDILNQEYMHIYDDTYIIIIDVKFSPYKILSRKYFLYKYFDEIEIDVSFVNKDFSDIITIN